MSPFTLAALAGALVCALWRVAAYAGESMEFMATSFGGLERTIAMVCAAAVVAGLVSMVRAHDERLRAGFAIALALLAAGGPLLEWLRSLA